ncbi:MAG: hypothetical protein K2O34_14610, partial [Acetatifactor sp.]|nr:hypothetical protein [Acetatifactor sp.]
MKIYRICATIFICLLLLTGCRKEEASDILSESVFEKESTANFDSDVNPDMDSFAATGELKTEQSLWA